MANARIVVVPILSNTLSAAGISVCLQAMALGKAVVITKGTSTHGILTKEVEELVPAGSVDALTVAVKKLWNEVTYRRELGKRAQQFAIKLPGTDRLSNNLQSFVVLNGKSLPRTS